MLPFTLYLLFTWLSSTPVSTLGIPTSLPLLAASQSVVANIACGPITCDERYQYCNEGFVRPECSRCSDICARNRIGNNHIAIQRCKAICPVYWKKQKELSSTTVTSTVFVVSPTHGSVHNKSNIQLSVIATLALVFLILVVFAVALIVCCLKRKYISVASRKGEPRAPAKNYVDDGNSPDLLSEAFSIQRACSPTSLEIRASQNAETQTHSLSVSSEAGVQVGLPDIGASAHERCIIHGRSMESVHKLRHCFTWPRPSTPRGVPPNEDIQGERSNKDLALPHYGAEHRSVPRPLCLGLSPTVQNDTSLDNGDASADTRRKTVFSIECTPPGSNDDNEASPVELNLLEDEGAPRSAREDEALLGKPETPEISIRHV